MPFKLSPTQLGFNARGDGRFNKPFQQQVSFFRQKLNLPTARYDDILKSAHDRAFVVAGAQKADLLDDLRKIVDKSIAEGKSINWFRKNFDNIVKQRGWKGWTGSDTQAGRDWRTRVIYRTNIASSYAAGRWQQLNDPDLLKASPYWKYIHNDTVAHPRPLHVSWSGLVLRHDDPFWQTHFPPNGWGCRCRVTSVRAKAYKGEKAPDNGVVANTDRPKGIDKGWDYAPGSTLEQKSQIQFVKDKADKLPKPLADAFVSEVSKVQFTPAKSIKAAEQYVIEQDIADFADYKGIKLEIANEMNQSLFEHIKSYPELRVLQKFIGTGQAQMARLHTLKATELAKRYKGNLTDQEKIARAKRVITKPRMNPKAYAHSVARSEVSGVAVNKKYGKDAAVFTKNLQRDVQASFHPVATATIKAVFDHEFAHQLDNLLKLSEDKVIRSIYNKIKPAGDMKEQLSRYADVNMAEFIAEAWSEFKNNPQPRVTAKKVGERINEIYRERK